MQNVRIYYSGKISLDRKLSCARGLLACSHCEITAVVWISGLVSGWFLDKYIKKFKWRLVAGLVEDQVTEWALISRHKALYIG